MKFKCKHKETEIREHSRRNHPFGRKDKPKFYKGYKFSEHCIECGKIIRKWKSRG